jgi:hypothetical protein
MSAFISESQSLRACNLPDTPHWRGWIRSQLPSQEISTGRIYERALVDHLAAKIRPLNGDIVLPPEPRAVPAEMQHSGPVDSGRPRRDTEPPLVNRIAQPDRTR